MKSNKKPGKILIFKRIVNVGKFQEGKGFIVLIKKRRKRKKMIKRSRKIKKATSQNLRRLRKRKACTW